MVAKSKLDKLKTELLMLFVPQRLLFHRVLFLEEEQLFFTLPKNLTTSLKLKNSQKVKLQESKLFKTQSEFHA